MCFYIYVGTGTKTEAAYGGTLAIRPYIILLQRQNVKKKNHYSSINTDIVELRATRNLLCSNAARARAGALHWDHE